MMLCLAESAKSVTNSGAVVCIHIMLSVMVRSLIHSILSCRSLWHPKQAILQALSHLTYFSMDPE